MSAISVFDVLDFVERRDDLTTNEVIVLVAIANRINKDTGYAYPSLENLRKTAKLTTRAIRAVLRSLESKYLLETMPAPSRYGANTYRLLIPRSDKIDSSKSKTEYYSSPPEHYSSLTSQGTKREKKSSHAREEEVRKETHDELDQLPGSGWNPRKLQLFGATLGSDFYNVCANGNGQHEKDSS